MDYTHSNPNWGVISQAISQSYDASGFIRQFQLPVATVSVNAENVPVVIEWQWPDDPTPVHIQPTQVSYVEMHDQALVYFCATPINSHDMATVVVLFDYNTRLWFIVGLYPNIWIDTDMLNFEYA